MTEMARHKVPPVNFRIRTHPKSARHAYELIEQADTAMKKLFLGEDLSQREWNSLLGSDYLEPTQTERREEGVEEFTEQLYSASTLQLASAHPFIYTDIETEILAYFGRHPELLYSLPPRKFEELIASVFHKNGFDVELTPETRDGGIDIIAVQRDDLCGGSLNLIECKRYLPHNTVGIGVVQRLYGVVEQHKATKGIIVTTSSFTKDAKEAAEFSKHRLVLNDYSNLTSWLKAFRK
ncbi:MAG: restriction endonuclease [Zoogloea sp.]|nr:restriction endonuclease [Zoogloea sp.]